MLAPLYAEQYRDRYEVGVAAARGKARDSSLRKAGGRA